VLDLDDGHVGFLLLVGGHLCVHLLSLRSFLHSQSHNAL
jgi:hypothetical protein